MEEVAGRFGLGVNGCTRGWRGCATLIGGRESGVLECGAGGVRDGADESLRCCVHGGGVGVVVVMTVPWAVWAFCAGRRIYEGEVGRLRGCWRGRLSFGSGCGGWWVGVHRRSVRRRQWR